MYPPASEGQIAPSVKRRQRRNAVHAASAGIRTTATLYAKTAPKASVSGAKTSASPGTLVAQARLKPPGAQITWVTNGFSPCRIACGHHANDQMKIWGSV